MTTTIRISATSWAYTAPTTGSMMGARRSLSLSPPKAEAVALTMVMPIWTVARNRSGCSWSAMTLDARRFPSSTSWRSRVLRRETIAISEPARRPLARISPRMKMSSPATTAP